jgi:glycerophosphoryl diester phosphodiesterase
MKIVGHRGAPGLAPENTIASLLKAIHHGVDEIECDVRVTKDNVVVLHHDTNVIDPTGKKFSIKKSAYQELKKHKPDLATLAEALESVNNKIPLQIEVKPRVNTKPIIQLLKKYPKAKLLLSSKKQKILRELHQSAPGIPKVVIEPWSGVHASSRARQVDTKRISMNQLWLWGGFIRAMRHYELYAYTMNDPKKARRWVEQGLAGIITDYPDRYQ